MGWVSYLNRAATTNYLCCGQALEDSLGAGRIGLTHILSIKLSSHHRDTSLMHCKDTYFFAKRNYYGNFIFHSIEK